MPRPRQLHLLCATVFVLLMMGMPASAQTAGQLVTTVPGTLFNNTLPPEQFAEICERAATTAFATGLSDGERQERIVAEGGQSLLIYRDVGLLVYLKTAPVSVYIGCYDEAQRVDRLKNRLLFFPPPAGDVVLYVRNDGRTRTDYPLTHARLPFLNAAGTVIREVTPTAEGDHGVPVHSGEAVVAWPAAYTGMFTNFFRQNDALAPDFAGAATLRIEFIQDDVPHVLDFAVIRP